MSFTIKFLALTLLLNLGMVRGEKEEEKEIDWNEMLQMGLALGKSILGEEAVDKLKKGDLSELVKVGEKVLGEEAVKDFINSMTMPEASSNLSPKPKSQDGGLPEDQIMNDEL